MATPTIIWPGLAKAKACLIEWSASDKLCALGGIVMAGLDPAIHVAERSAFSEIGRTE